MKITPLSGMVAVPVLQAFGDGIRTPNDLGCDLVVALAPAHDVDLSRWDCDATAARASPWH